MLYKKRNNYKKLNNSKSYLIFIYEFYSVAPFSSLAYHPLSLPPFHHTKPSVEIKTPFI